MSSDNYQDLTWNELAALIQTGFNSHRMRFIEPVWEVTVQRLDQGVLLRIFRPRNLVYPEIDLRVIVRPWATVLLAAGELIPAAQANVLLHGTNVLFEFGQDYCHISIAGVSYSLLPDRLFDGDAPTDAIPEAAHLQT